MCGNPICRHILTLEIHHIIWVRDGGSNASSNLLPLCPNCHSAHTAGHIPTEAIRVWKGALASLNNPHRQSADLLLLLHRWLKGPSQKGLTLPLSGLLQLAGLINSGLLSILGGMWGSDGTSAFTVVLTDRGRDLIDAWIAGDPRRLRAAIG